MTPREEELIKIIAEQAFMFHKLVQRLIDLEILRPGELTFSFDESDATFDEFLQDVLRRLDSSGS